MNNCIYSCSGWMATRQSGKMSPCLNVWDSECTFSDRDDGIRSVSDLGKGRQFPMAIPMAIWQALLKKHTGPLNYWPYKKVQASSKTLSVSSSFLMNSTFILQVEDSFNLPKGNWDIVPSVSPITMEKEECNFSFSLSFAHLFAHT